MSAPKPISAEEAYAVSYRVFWNAVYMLALDARGQCEAMGNYNVAWELKDDVSAGIYLLGTSACLLDPLQRLGITELIKALQTVPPEVLRRATSAEENHRAMSDPCWVPLRVKAAEVLRTLPEPEHGA